LRPERRPEWEKGEEKLRKDCGREWERTVDRELRKGGSDRGDK
jgi:hypothetical protein